jgi:hypothetical protein
MMLTMLRRPDPSMFIGSGLNGIAPTSKTLRWSWWRPFG